MKRVAAWCAAVWIGLFCVDASAERIRFVADSDDPFERRLQAEVASVGFEVERPESRELPLAADTVAIVAVNRDPLRVELWLVEADGPRLSAVIERDLSADEQTDTARVAERLRALLQPIKERLATLGPAHGPLPPPPEPRNEPAPPAPIADRPVPARTIAPAESVVPESRPRFALDVALAALAQPGGIGTSLALRAGYEFSDPFGAFVFGALPLTSTRVEQAGASAELEARFAGAGVFVRAPLDSAPLELRLNAGLSALWLTATGEVSPPRSAKPATAFTTLPFLGPELVLAVTRQLRVSLAGLAGVTLPRPDLRFAGDYVGSYGRPLLWAQLGVGVAL